MAAQKEINRRLKRWGLWLYVCDDPGVGHKRVNTLARIAKPQDFDWFRYEYTDWTDAEEVDRVVNMLARLPQEQWRIDCLKSKFEYVEDYERCASQKERWELQRKRFCTMQGIDIGGTAYRSRVNESVIYVQGALMMLAEVA